MKIAFIDSLGLTYDGSTLTKRGHGGSESALIRISQELVKLGFEVTVFNDCTSDDSRPGLYDGVQYVPIGNHGLSQEIYDVCIVSRSVKPIVEDWEVVKTAKHVCLWMHDTFCEGDNLIEDLILEDRLDEIFTLSDWHTAYVTHAEHGKRRNFDILKNHIFVTRNGIGNMNPGWIDIKAKDPFLFVFNSAVTKGMIPLVKDVWPRVKQHIPQAKLKVIGGFYRFSSSHGPDQQELDWRQLVSENPDIDFTGIISQQEISEILRDASYMIYPAGFPETFGISTLEALAHNVPIITCRFGALEETAIDIASYKIPYPVEPNWSVPWLNRDNQVNIFVDTVLRAFNTPYLHQQKMYACNQVKDICTWDTVALQWKQHLYKKLGEYLPVEEYQKVKRINAKVRKVFNRRFMNMEEIVEDKQPNFNRITVVTPAYNAEKYIERCILSVAQQDYIRYNMVIIDDCSTDATVEVARRTINNLPKSLQNKFELIENKINQGAVYNQVTAIQKCSEDIIMLLDGDDWLVNDPTLFDKYNNIYNDGAEFTYGSCWSVVDNIPLIAQEYPPEIKNSKQYRSYKFNWNMPYTHLRTFKASLMHGYIKEHGVYAFQDPSTFQWLKAGGDTAVFYAMIEYAAPDRVVCVSEIVYNYNDANPLNDYKVNSDEQTKNAELVLGQHSPFQYGQYDLRPL